MNATKVLSFLIDSLKEAGIIRYNKDFLYYIKISKEIVSPKQLSGFIQRDGDIQNRLFLKEIETYFNFPKSIWTSNEERQKNLIKKAIKHELDLQSLPNEDAIDVSSLIPTELPCSEEQLGLLKDFSTVSTKTQSEEMIDRFLSLGLLDKKLENQEFLVRLLKLVYDKGLYVIIVEFIVPSLYKRYYDKIEVQKYLAHTYGSLKQYSEAKHILGILIHHNTIENINLRTSALSNHKREIFATPSKPIETEKLYALIQGYQELHAIKGIYSYYTGINLLYMVVLGQILFPDDTRFAAIDTQAIYDKSKPSLKEDKTHHDYYVAMSGFEFQLLLSREGVLEKIESFLANDEPHVSLVERSARQMRLFLEATKESESSSILIAKFKNAIEILEGYCKISNTF